MPKKKENGVVGTEQNSVGIRTRSGKQKELEKKRTQEAEQELNNKSPNSNVLKTTSKNLESPFKKEETLESLTIEEYVQKKQTASPSSQNLQRKKQIKPEKGDGVVGTVQNSVGIQTRSGKQRELERKRTQEAEQELNIINNNKSPNSSVLKTTSKNLESPFKKEETLGSVATKECIQEEITMGEIKESDQSPDLNGGSGPLNDNTTPSGAGDVLKEPSSRNGYGKVDNQSDPHCRDLPADSNSSLDSVFKIRDMVVKNGPALETFHASGTSITDAQDAPPSANTKLQATMFSVTKVENFQDIDFHNPHAESIEGQHGVASSGQMKPVLRRCRIKQNVKRVEPESVKDLKREQSTDSSIMYKRRKTEEAQLANQHKVAEEHQHVPVSMLESDSLTIKGIEGSSIASGFQPMVEDITPGSTIIASERPISKVPLGAEGTSRTIYLQKVEELHREFHRVCADDDAQAAGLLQDINRLTKCQLTIQGEYTKLTALLDAKEKEHKAALEAKDKEFVALLATKEKEYVEAILAKDAECATLVATKDRVYKDALESKIAGYNALAASKDARIQKLTEEVGAAKNALAVSIAITGAAKTNMAKAVMESTETQGQLRVAEENLRSATIEATVSYNAIVDKYKHLYQMYKRDMGVEPQGIEIPSRRD